MENISVKRNVESASYLEPAGVEKNEDKICSLVSHFTCIFSAAIMIATGFIAVSAASSLLTSMLPFSAAICLVFIISDQYARLEKLTLPHTILWNMILTLSSATYLWVVLMFTWELPSGSTLVLKNTAIGTMLVILVSTGGALCLPNMARLAVKNHDIILYVSAFSFIAAVYYGSIFVTTFAMLIFLLLVLFILSSFIIDVNLSRDTKSTIFHYQKIVLYLLLSFGLVYVILDLLLMLFTQLRVLFIPFFV